MSFEKLIGKNILEVIAEIPKIKEWNIFQYGFISSKYFPRQSPRLKQIILVDYDGVKPKADVDTYFQIPVEQISQDNIYYLIENLNDRCRILGITSLVQLKPQDEFDLRDTYVHIPFLDFDAENILPNLSDSEIQNLIKTKIRDDLFIKKGLLLRSGPKRNYHYFGLGQLLNPSEFLTFLGLALNINVEASGQRKFLVDSRFVAHSLTAQKDLYDLNWEEENHFDLTNISYTNTPYANESRFSTLRVSAKMDYTELPRVVDVI